MAMRRPEPRSGGRGEVGEELNGRVKQLGGERHIFDRGREERRKGPWERNLRTDSFLINTALGPI